MLGEVLVASQNRVKISIVSPVYHGSGCLRELYQRLIQVLEGVVDPFEIVLVNDASPDDSWDIILELAAADSRVKGVDLSRNFGQHCAITAGLDHAAGDWVVVMDCDLQDRPEEIPRLYERAMEGYDIVFARRKNRKDGFLKRLSSRVFHRLYNFLSDIKTDRHVSNFSIVSSTVVTAMGELRERNRAYSVFLQWLGFQTSYIDVEHGERFSGKSSYGLTKSIRLAVEAITSQSNKPLRLSIYIGFLMSAVSFLYAAYRIIRYYTHGVDVDGWTSLMVAGVFIGGLILANLGVVGLYLGKVFDESKHRPLYITRQLVNMETADTRAQTSSPNESTS